MHDKVDGVMHLNTALTTTARPSLGRARRAMNVARLVCRLYGSASPALRARVVSSLVRPLGTLGTAGIAAGAFGVLLYRDGSEGARSAMAEVARFSNDQIVELVRFVEQVSPDALLELAQVFADRPVGIAAFSASVATLLMHALRQRGPGG